MKDNIVKTFLGSHADFFADLPIYRGLYISDGTE